MYGAMHRVDVYGRDNIKACLFEAKAKSSCPCKQIYSEWPRHYILDP